MMQFLSPTEAKTINDMINLVGRFILYLGGLAAAIAGIWALIEKVRSRGAMAKMQLQIKDLEEHVDNDNKRLKRLEDTNDDNKLELQDLHSVSRLTLSAVQQLLKSNLENGNNHSGMQKASDNIDEYLKSKI